MPAVYDRLAAFYDLAFSPFEKRFLQRWRREALTEIPIESRILELGCGTGANFAFYPPFSLAVSSELSAKMLAKAAGRKASNHLVQCDAQKLPFPDNAFDAAFATLVFCSIPDPQAAFFEVMRVLVPGGRLVLLEHVRPPGWGGRVFDALNVLTVALIDDHFNRETSRIATEAGLELVEVRSKARGAVNLIVCRNP